MSEPQTVFTIRAEKFEPWRLLGDYKLVDSWINQHPQGFDIRVDRHGTYQFRPDTVPRDPEILSYGIYVYNDKVYYITNTKYGVQRRPRGKKNQPVLGTGEETSKTLPPALD